MRCRAAVKLHKMYWESYRSESPASSHSRIRTAGGRGKRTLRRYLGAAEAAAFCVLMKMYLCLKQDTAWACTVICISGTFF